MDISYNKSKTAIAIKQSSNCVNTELKEKYYDLNLDYSKFFKMDSLCKLGILGVELLLIENRNLFANKNNVGIILQNKSSSLDSDLKHQSGIENNAVSPAVFVYTLPNIVIGEISIKYKWKSEGVFFIDEEIDYELLSQYSNTLLKERRTNLNLIGWIDVIKSQYSLKLCVVDFQIPLEGLRAFLD